MEEMRSLVASPYQSQNGSGVPRKPIRSRANGDERNDSTNQDTSVGLALIPREEHNETGRSPTRRMKHESRDLGRHLWIAEILSYTLALVALAAIVITLALHNNKPLPQWPSLISINSLVAIFTSILKAAMLLPVAEGISELKWLWFARPRSLNDLDQFDSASRGPWGSLKLLFRIPKSYLTAFGALITIIALAIDPFTQQILQYYNCLQPVSGATALIPRTNNYTAAGMHTGAGETSLDGPMAATLYVGLLDPPTNATSSIPTTCPTGNCTFPTYQDGVSYSSIAMCSSVEDISHTITGNGTFYNYSLPSGAHTFESTLLNTVMVTTMNAEDSNLFVFDALMINDHCNSSTLEHSEECPTLPWAVRCSLYPCVHTYSNVNISASTLAEQLISTNRIPFMNMSEGFYFSLAGNYPSIPTVDCTPSEHPTENNTQPTSILHSGLRYVNLTHVPGASDTLWYNPLCTWEFGIGSTEALTEYLYGFYDRNNLSAPYGSPDNTVGDAWLEQLYQHGTANINTTANYMSGLANAMTSTMRQRGDAFNSEPATGTILTNQTCIRVAWAWLALPAALLLCTFVFLATIMLQTHRYTGHGKPQGGRGPWKSSSLPLLWCGLEEKTRRRYGAIDDVDQMKERGKGLKVQLRKSVDLGAETDSGQWELSEHSKPGVQG